MIVEVTSAAVSRRIAHLEAVKRDLSITDTSEDSEILQAIDIVSAEFVRLMGREPWMQTYKVRLPGNGGTFLRLPVWPLVSVSLVRAGVTSPTTVTASDYEIASTGHAGERRDQLYNSEGWARSVVRDPTLTSADQRTLHYEVTGVAGWATPIDRWSASTAVRVGEYTRSTDRTVAVRFECTTAGTTDSSEPTWDTTAGNTTSDNTVVWTARTALEMPENLWAAAMWSVKEVHRTGLPGGPAGVKADRWGDQAITYGSAPGLSGSLLPSVSHQIVENYA